MKFDQMFPSNYLKKEDVVRPLVLTIAGIVQEEFRSDEGVELKPVVHWREPAVKPMVLNRINATILADLYGDDTDGWLGRPVEVYADNTVMMAGRRVGGVRVRAPAAVNVPPAFGADGQVRQARELVASAEAEAVAAGFCVAGDLGTFIRDRAAAAFEAAGKPVPDWVGDLARWPAAALARVESFVQQFKEAFKGAAASDIPF